MRVDRLKGCRREWAVFASTLLALGASGAYAAVQYRVGLLQNLSGGTTFTTGRAVNDDGVVAGDAGRTSGVSVRIPAVRWGPGVSSPTELGFFNVEDGFGWGINSSGDVAGQLTVTVAGQPVTKPVVWAAGGTGATMLSTFLSSALAGGRARAISDHGVVVGYADGAGAARWRPLIACRWR